MAVGTPGGSRHSLRTAMMWVRDPWLPAAMLSLKSGAQAQTDPRTETCAWGGGGDEPLPFPATWQMENASVAGAPSGMKDPSSPAGVQGAGPSSRVPLGTWESSQGRRVNWAKVTPSSRGSPHPGTENSIQRHEGLAAGLPVGWPGPSRGPHVAQFLPRLSLPS